MYTNSGYGEKEKVIEEHLCEGLLVPRLSMEVCAEA
jgi:hypothetical protein